MWEVLKGTIRMQIHPDRIKASHLDKTAPLPLVEVGQVGKEKSGGGGCCNKFTLKVGWASDHCDQARLSIEFINIALTCQ